VKRIRAKIAKDFHWEMGHRLPFHDGGCQNVHGHSYQMRVTVEGDLDENGMVIDYFDLKAIIDPVVQSVDHAFMIDETDQQMRAFFEANPLKHVVVPFPTTAENITRWFLDRVAERLRTYPNVKSVSVRVQETERTYAEMTQEL
jgi:6-pyruvoyltetrahydropterin/6-carboxytetrahydropterin synthase